DCVVCERSLSLPTLRLAICGISFFTALPLPLSKLDASARAKRQWWSSHFLPNTVGTLTLQPFAPLWACPAIAACVTNAGWKATAGSRSHGVPVLRQWGLITNAPPDAANGPVR